MARGIDVGQIKLIHVLKSAVGLDDDTYRSMLAVRFGVDTSKALDFDQARALIAELEASAVSMGTFVRGKEKYGNAQRPGMASPKQLRMIEALWREVSRARTGQKRKSALRGFVFRIAGVSDLRFLDVEGVRKVVHALKTMKARKEAGTARDENAVGSQ